MRVLLTTDTIGGVWTFTRELTGQLLRLGHSVTLVSFGRAPSPQQQAWSNQVAAGYTDTFHHQATGIALEWMQDNSSCYKAGSAAILAKARQLKPDILHTNQFCFGAISLDIPKLITAHSDVLSWAAMCHPQGLQPSSWLDRYCGLVQQGLDKADAVAAPTVWMLGALREQFELGDQTSVVSNGRALPAFTGNQERKLQAVSAGRMWDEAKGLTSLLSINAPLPLLVAGKVEADTSSTPAPQVRGVTMLGELDETELLSLFRKSSIYVVTSIYEPFGLAPLEAALCGCAVVARDIPSLREVWRDAALYFTEGSSLERLLKALANDPAKLRDAQAASVRRATEFTAARMAESYISLYEKLTSTKQLQKELSFDAA